MPKKGNNTKVAAPEKPKPPPPPPNPLLDAHKAALPDGKPPALLTPVVDKGGGWSWRGKQLELIWDAMVRAKSVEKRQGADCASDGFEDLLEATDGAVRVFAGNCKTSDGSKHQVAFAVEYGSAESVGEREATRQVLELPPPLAFVCFQMLTTLHRILLTRERILELLQANAKTARDDVDECISWMRDRLASAERTPHVIIAKCAEIYGTAKDMHAHYLKQVKARTTGGAGAAPPTPDAVSKEEEEAAPAATAAEAGAPDEAGAELEALDEDSEADEEDEDDGESPPPPAEEEEGEKAEEGQAKQEVVEQEEDDADVDPDDDDEEEEDDDEEDEAYWPSSVALREAQRTLEQEKERHRVAMANLERAALQLSRAKEDVQEASDALHDDRARRYARRQRKEERAASAKAVTAPAAPPKEGKEGGAAAVPSKRQAFPRPPDGIVTAPGRPWSGAAAAAGEGEEGGSGGSGGGGEASGDASAARRRRKRKPKRKGGGSGDGDDSTGAAAAAAAAEVAIEGRSPESAITDALKAAAVPAPPPFESLLVRLRGLAAGASETSALPHLFDPIQFLANCDVVLECRPEEVGRAAPEMAAGGKWYVAVGSSKCAPPLPEETEEDDEQGSSDEDDDEGDGDGEDLNDIDADDGAGGRVKELTAEEAEAARAKDRAAEEAKAARAAALAARDAAEEETVVLVVAQSAEGHLCGAIGWYELDSLPTDYTSCLKRDKALPAPRRCARLDDATWDSRSFMHMGLKGYGEDFAPITPMGHSFQGTVLYHFAFALHQYWLARAHADLRLLQNRAGDDEVAHTMMLLDACKERYASVAAVASEGRWVPPELTRCESAVQGLRKTLLRRPWAKRCTQCGVRHEDIEFSTCKFWCAWVV